METSGGTRGEIEELKTELEKALGAARSAIRDTTRVSRLLTALSEPAPVEVLSDRILSTISELFMAEIVILLDPAGRGSFKPFASIGLPDDMEERLISELDVARAFRTYGESTVLTLEDIGSAAAAQDFEGLGIRTIAWIPMKGSRVPRGAMVMARCTALPFSREDLSLLSAMAYRIALTLEQLQNKQQLELIARGNQEITDQLDMVTILREAVRIFPTVMGASAAAIFTSTEHGPFFCEQASVELKESMSGALFLTDRPGERTALARDGGSCLAEDNRYLVFAEGGSFPYRSAAIAEIPRNGGVMSLLCAFRRDPIDFTPESRQIATLYARQIAAALENARLYEELQEELWERRRVERSLRENEKRVSALIRNISDVIAVLNVLGEITFVGDAVRTLWGLPPETLIGTRLIERVHPEDVAAAEGLLVNAMNRPMENRGAVIRLRVGETDAWRYFDVIMTNQLGDTSVKGIISTFHDVTERKVFEKGLSDMAFRDPLTGLANRAHFYDRVRFTFSHSDAQSSPCAVIFFDLDNFKSINDALGHAAGDETLKVVADRVRGCLRSNDTAARLGGDEFTIFVEKARDAQQLVPLLDRLQGALQADIQLNGTELHIGGSIGLAMSIPGGDDVESLLHRADLAMYRAKKQGKGRYVVYDPAFDG